ncbi:c-type cytochrome [Magnetofaba australis]|nr:cytochrome c [Magnetofaba australis]
MKKLFALAAFGASLAIAPVVAHADDDAIVLHRQSVMEGIGAGMGTVVCVLKKQCDLPQKVVIRQAKTMHFLAKMNLEAFRAKTEGPLGVKTTALPKIWSDWADYEKDNKEMVEATEGLIKAAASSIEPQSLGPAVQALGKVCKECHDDFREKH